MGRLKAIPRASGQVRQGRRRRAAATLDYVLVMGIVLPLAVIVYKVAPRMMNLVYELTCVSMGWPFQ
jgi:hypothetical protein